MKVAVFSPYIPKHFGGGDAYIWRVAASLAKKHHVSMAISSSTPLSSQQVSEIKRKYEAFLGFSLSDINVIAAPLFTAQPWWKKLWWTRQFDLLYYLTDGSLFPSLAAKNILHIQIPFTQPQRGVLNRLKLRQWRIKNANSEFTRRVVSKAWQTSVPFVHYPAVVEPAAKVSSEKQPCIVHVGRFFRQLHSKRQDVLIQMFEELRQREPRHSRGWKLQLIGGIEDEKYVAELKKQAVGLPVEFFHDLTHEELQEKIASASIYWHATGAGIDETQHPEQQEHFGISTVEALAAGCAPVVIDQGGQPEVLGAVLQDWLWVTPAEGVTKTAQLIANPSELREIQEQALRRSHFFNQQRFDDTLQEMIYA